MGRKKGKKMSLSQQHKDQQKPNNPRFLKSKLKSMAKEIIENTKVASQIYEETKSNKVAIVTLKKGSSLPKNLIEVHGQPNKEKDDKKVENLKTTRLRKKAVGDFVVDNDVGVMMVEASPIRKGKTLVKNVSASKKDRIGKDVGERTNNVVSSKSFGLSDMSDDQGFSRGSEDISDDSPVKKTKGQADCLKSTTKKTPSNISANSDGKNVLEDSGDKMTKVSKRKKKNTKRKKTESEVEENLSMTKSSADEVADSYDPVMTMHRNQRNMPSFESKILRKNFDKRLAWEWALSGEGVDNRSYKDLHGTGSKKDDEEDEEMFVEDDDSDENEEVMDDSLNSDNSESVSNDTEGSENDPSLLLKEQEALFFAFGHEDSENRGAFGSGMTPFRFQNKPGDDEESAQDAGNPVRIHEDTKRTETNELGTENETEESTRNETSNTNDVFVNEVRCVSFPLPNKEASIVVLPHPQELCIQGKAEITMVTGQMVVMGHKLHPGKVYELYSPLSHSYLVLKTVQGEPNLDHVAKDVATILEKDSKHFAEAELNDFHSDHCVSFVVRPLDSETHRYISKMSPYNGLFTIRSSGPFPYNENLFPLGLGLFPLKCVMRPWTTLTRDTEKILDLWQTLLERGDKSVSGRAPVIIVCGGKNSGKSTFNRHLINAGLNSTSAVNYLELDVGQPECSMSGCVSLYTLEQPVFGPPFTHLMKAERSCFYGWLSAGVDVSTYTRCVEFVYAAHKGDNPLIVNTMGWNRDIGLKLLVDVLHITNPDIVVQINSHKQTDNFPPLTSKFKMAEEGWLYNTLEQKASRRNEGGNHELCVIQTPVRKMQEKFIPWTAADHRNIALISYFSDGLHCDKSLLSLAPFTVPWSSISIHVCQAVTLTPSQILLAINGSIVGLCQSDRQGVTEAEATHPRLLPTFPICHCVGFGLVRGVDTTNKLLYIVTPLTLDDLDKVNVLVKGGLTLPEQVARQQKTGTKKPYWDDIAQGLGSWKTSYKSRKMRRPGSIYRKKYEFH